MYSNASSNEKIIGGIILAFSSFPDDAMVRIKPKTKDIGRYVRVFFNCVGAQDGILIDVDENNNSFRFLNLNSYQVECNNAATIIAMGKRVPAHDFE